MPFSCAKEDVHKPGLTAYRAGHEPIVAVSLPELAGLQRIHVVERSEIMLIYVEFKRQAYRKIRNANRENVLYP